MSIRKSKSIAVVQSNYIPWKGYFDLIASVDEFLLFDEVQYTKRDWRNRNQIKTSSGPLWLSVPVKVKSRFEQRILDVELCDDHWRDKHLRSIAQAYARSPHFRDEMTFIERLYRESPGTRLSEVNKQMIEMICERLGIKTRITSSADYAYARGEKSIQLRDLCHAAGADIYVSGPAARGYLDVESFRDAGIDARFFDYSGYAEYPQLHGEFIHEVSIVDLLLNAGVHAPRYMKHVAP
jgi:hypothetical protein